MKERCFLIRATDLSQKESEEMWARVCKTCIDYETEVQARSPEERAAAADPEPEPLPEL